MNIRLNFFTYLSQEIKTERTCKIVISFRNCPKIHYIFIVRHFQIQAGKSKTKKHLGDLEVDEGKEYRVIM
jgi:hypothetical protein